MLYFTLRGSHLRCCKAVIKAGERKHNIPDDKSVLLCLICISCYKRMSHHNIFCSSMAHRGISNKTSIPENLQSMAFVCIYIQCKKWWTAYIPLSVWWGWVSDKTLYILEILICKVRPTLLYGFLCCCFLNVSL